MATIYWQRAVRRMVTLWVCVAKSRQMLTELTIFGTQKALASLLTPKFNLRISDLYNNGLIIVMLIITRPRQWLNGNVECCPSHPCSPTSSALGSHSRQSMGTTQWETCACSPRLVLSNHSMVPCAYSVVNKVTHLWYGARLLSLPSLNHPVFDWVLYTFTYTYLNSLPTNDGKCRHDLCELSISFWEFIWGF